MSFEEGLFIETIEQFSCLWDLSNPKHKDKLAIENAWSTIASVSNMSVEECKDTWKSIRLKFIRERKLVKDMPSGSGSYTGAWPNFVKVGFLAPHIQIRKTKTNMAPKRKIEAVAGPSWMDMMVGDDGFLSSSATEPDSAKSRGETPDNLSETIIDVSETIIDETQDSFNFITKIPQDSFDSIEKTPSIPSVLRREKNRKINKKVAAESEDMSKIAETCASVGQNITRFLNKATEQETEEEDDNKDKADIYFGRSLGEMLERIKNKKKKTLLKAKILTMIAEELESDDE